jgi:signal peptidase
MKRALGWVVNIILIWLLIIVITLFLLPRFSGWRFDAILSGSMEPALPLGGVVAIKPVEPVDISTGDIIAYRSGKVLVTHRVVELLISGGGEPSFVTKGDANQDPDLSPVPASSVVGKAVFDIPYLGYLAAFIKTRLGFLLTIFLPGLAIIALELKNMWQAVLKEDRGKAKPEAIPPPKTARQPTTLYDHPQVTASGRSSLVDRIVIGVIIGVAVAIIALLTIAFLNEVL